jgi:hypothetical protein
MINAKTVFIIGAGASSEVGLPSGSELKNIIANDLNIKFDDFGQNQISGNRQITQALRRHVTELGIRPPDINPYLHEGWAITDAMPQAISIDNFLEAHKDNEKIVTCGKLAIVRAILEAEKNSTLHATEGQKLSFNNLSGSWYPELFKLLSEGISKGNCNKIFNNVSFIIFNYDRCVEHYLVNALSNYYLINSDESQSIVNQAKILHPYGVVGNLPWQKSGSESVDFGNLQPYTDLLSMAKQIKTFTEQVESKEILSSIKSEVQSAKVLVSLGFGYLNQNLELLKPGTTSDTQRIFGTCKGLSPSDTKYTISQIHSLLNSHSIKTTELEPCTCYELFGKFRRSLSMGV